MKVKSIIQPITPLRFDSSWTAFEILQFMDCLEQRYVTIVDGERLLGIVTEHDIQQYALDLGLLREDLKEVPISRVIDDQLFLCNAEDSMDEALETMDAYGLNYLAVKDRGHIIGLVSRRNLQEIVDIDRPARPDPAFIESDCRSRYALS